MVCWDSRGSLLLHGHGHLTGHSPHLLLGTDTASHRLGNGGQWGQHQDSGGLVHHSAILPPRQSMQPEGTHPGASQSLEETGGPRGTGRRCCGQSLSWSTWCQEWPDSLSLALGQQRCRWSGPL